MATGLAAALNYILGFVATKTYYNLELWISIPGTTLFYSIINIFGFVSIISPHYFYRETQIENLCFRRWIVMYAILPETEDRTLEDIELHFSDNNRKLTDRKIAKFDGHPKIQHVKGDNTIPTISTMIDTEWPQKLGSAKTGCDNEGFAMESTKC